MSKILIDEAVVGFEEWWSNEGSQAPKPTDDMYEHCKRMCEIAWANGAYKALEQPAPAPDPDELAIAYLNGIDTGKKRKPWVGLTDEEIDDIEATWEATQEWVSFSHATRVIEAKLKEKNQ